MSSGLFTLRNIKITMIKVSIIVPNYNHASYLTTRLDSILNQTFKDYEIILLDDCSTDRSIEILSKYKSHPKVAHIIINKYNSGSPFKQWRKGIELSKGEFIWIAESDDWADPKFLEECFGEMDKYPHENIGLINCNSNVIKNGNVIINTKDWIKDYDQLIKNSPIINGKTICKDYLTEHNIFPNASAIILKKDVLAKISLPYSYKICGDWHIWFEILQESDLLYIDKTLNNFRKHDSNITHSNRLLLQREGIQVLQHQYHILKKQKINLFRFYNSYLKWCFYGSFWDKTLELSFRNFKYYLFSWDINLFKRLIVFLLNLRNS